MSNPYLCPNCKTNHSRFNIIEQIAKPVKLDPQTGKVMDEYINGDAGIFHKTYDGPKYRVQCASCGLVETEESFVKYAEYNQRTKH